MPVPQPHDGLDGELAFRGVEPLGDGVSPPHGVLVVGEESGFQTGARLPAEA
jgi:hypothetical protein